MKRLALISALAALAWAASMAELAERHYFFDEPPLATAAEAPPGWLFEERWMGIYRGADKIGYASSGLEPADGGYRAVENTFMSIKALGAKKEVATSTKAFLDQGFRLMSFSFELDSDVSVEVRGVRKGKEMLMTMEMAGVKTEKRLSIDEAPYLGPTLAPLLRSPEPGKRISIPVVEPSSLSSGTLELEVIGKENVTVMGRGRETYKLMGNYMGADFTLWVEESGEIIKQEAMGFTFLKETEEEARKPGTASIDLIADMAVPVDAHIPEGVSYLKVRLEGVGLGGFELHGGVQKLSEGNVLEIEIPSLPKESDAQAGMEEYLRDSLLVESGAPSIVSRAREIAGGEEGIVNRARLIYEWVYENVEKAPTITIPSALEVLGSLRGDCNEHTALYTALARAAGVPTRIALGIVHQEGRFFYHAWPEVYLGGWVPVDPTLGQFPADATHIRLLTGGLEKQLKLGSAIGKLEVEVLERGVR